MTTKYDCPCGAVIGWITKSSEYYDKVRTQGKCPACDRPITSELNG